MKYVKSQGLRRVKSQFYISYVASFFINISDFEIFSSFTINYSKKVDKPKLKLVNR